MDSIDSKSIDLEAVSSQPTERRIRTLTVKGMEMYETTRDEYNVKLEKAWKNIEDVLAIFADRPSDINSLRKIENDLVKCYDKYCTLSTEYLDFLSKTSTQESLKELETHFTLVQAHKMIVENTLKRLHTFKQHALESGSLHSNFSIHTAKSKTSGSTTSNISSVLARKRAKADAARARLGFAEKEARIRKQQALLDEQEKLSKAIALRKKAELEADLELLAHQKEAAAAEAEVEALQSVSEDRGESNLSEFDVSQPQEPMERVRYYVSQQTELPENTHFKPDYDECGVKQGVHHSVSYTPTPLMIPNFIPTTQPVIQTCRRVNHYDQGCVSSVSLDLDQVHESGMHKNASLSTHRPTVLNADAPAYHPNNGQVDYAPAALQPQEYSSQSIGTEMTRFLLKKDLLLSRLSNYNDRPEFYTVWKACFLSVVRELQVTTNEEIDLLVKWLGPESSKHALSIRASNVNNPSRGLQRIWERLDERYGSPEMVEAALKTKLADFPKLTNKDNKKLYELSDILSEIESVKEDKRYQSLLGYYDSSSGVLPIVNKLPYGIQERWTTQAVNYKKHHNVSFPPFSFFAEFIREISKVKNDPGFAYEISTITPTKKEKTPLRNAGNRPMISTKKTQVSRHSDVNDVEPDKRCPLHKTNHSLNKCRGFKLKPLEERKKLLKENGICFRCCESTKHILRACKEVIQCADCGSDRHPTALHVTAAVAEKLISKSPAISHGGEKEISDSSFPRVTSKCTQICGEGFVGKSCAKTVLVRVYPNGHPAKAIKMYAILDDQSNRSLAKSDFFNLFDIQDKQVEYTLSSCTGCVVTYGRRASGYVVEALNGSARLELPTLIECNQIPDIREEIPTPEVAEHHPHLNDIARHIQPLDAGSSILLLIGRDLTEAHHVHDQRIGPRNSPYAQRLSLGWVIIGEACLGKVHKPDFVNVNKTYLLGKGRTSIFRPCPNGFKIKETHTRNVCTDDNIKLYFSSFADAEGDLGAFVFERTKNDDQIGMSIEDKEFLKIMDEEFYKDPHGNWVAPLPFRTPRQRLPNNRPQAIKRAKTLDASLRRDPVKKQHFVTFMQRIFDSGHAELAPSLKDDEERWYLPIFGVYHPKKPDQIRGVFDSSAKYDGVSLNNVLLSGPDMTNNLLGILLRFRKGPIAVTADIQQMFHCFLVREDHRNFLRFFWYRDNNLDEDLVEYRMCVHVFGNSPSPAVATYGLRRTAQNSERDFGVDVKEFVQRNFYVDDGLTSLPTSAEAIDLMKRTQRALNVEGNLRLHKIASNSDEVMNAFPSDDLARDLKDLDLSEEILPLQHSLGLTWDLKSDSFRFQVSSEEKPYTRRGILSTVNSLFDPIGFVAPVTIQGKIFLRNLISGTTDWDEVLPVEHQAEWEDWRDSLQLLENVKIPRTYSSMSLNTTVKNELHIFSDASEKAIAAVAHLKTTVADGSQQIGFVLGKAKVAPKHGHTIPRLELCAAVLAVEIFETISDHLDIIMDSVRFYTDSKVVLGYIHNQTRRFYVYVSNRVERIRKSTRPEQWTYISTDLNPADYATRSIPAARIQDSPWVLGPSHLLRKDKESFDDIFPLLDADEDKELRPKVDVLKTIVSKKSSLGSHRFERFSSWKNLVETFARLRHIVLSYCGNERCKGWHMCSEFRTVETYHKTEHFIIKVVQHEMYSRELTCLEEKKPLPRDSPVLSLSPVIDEDGILRVGGRLNRADLSIKEKNPLIIPGRHHIATLLVRHHHDNVKHQGRHFTEGAVRAAGLWIIGGKRLISSLIHKCVKCRKLRGKQEYQKMSDLPPDRLEPVPPFTYVGVDTFGPWSVIARRTRGGLASSKRWAILFTCLTIRAIHIEVIEDLSTSAFINAFRRFISIRGNVRELRSDRGTNFIGSTDDLKIDAINVEDSPVKDFLYKKGIIWIFNPPHSSHMGGVWERMIGITRRILDSMMTEVESKNLTNEVLITFMAEVCSIVNARPIVPVSSDPESPMILSPSVLLTQKTDIITEPFGPFEMKDLYKAQWKRVQTLADIFWNRWRREYLQTLQSRRKWQIDRTNIKQGDIVLLKDKTVCRNEWPVGVIVNSIPGGDDRVRKAEVRVTREGQPTIYTRPITEMILLLTEESTEK